MTFNREAYLQDVAKEFRRDFKRLGVTVPAVHISVGHVGRGKTIGGTYPRYTSADKRNHIFVDPFVVGTNLVICVLGHELVHAALDCAGGHGREFQLLARQIGFVKPYAEPWPSPELDERIKEIVAKLGKYKHPQLNLYSSPPSKCRMR